MNQSNKTRSFEFSDGVTHEKYLRKWGWSVILFMTIPVFVISKLNVLYPILLIANFLLCEYIDPDLDQLGLTKSEGDLMRTARKYGLGFLGAVFVSYTFIYAFLIDWLGRVRKWVLKKLFRITGSRSGHRSPESHGWPQGTLIRMLFFNFPASVIMYVLYLQGVSSWDWHEFYKVGMGYYWMDIWLIPHLVTQFIAWSVGDLIHIILDTEWFKKSKYSR